jgi:hypothetical protein
MAEYSEDQKRIDYGFFFGSDAGRRVFFDLMDFCGLLKPGSDEGARNVFLYIMAQIMPQIEDRARFIRKEIVDNG